MKRSPRWMVIFAVVAMMSSWVPSGVSAMGGPIALPEPGVVTIGDPDPTGSGKSYHVPPGDFVVIAIAGGTWTIRLGSWTCVFRRHVARGWSR